MLYGDIILPTEALGTDLLIGPNRLIAKQRAVSCPVLGPQALLETRTPEHLASSSATPLALGGPPGAWPSIRRRSQSSCLFTKAPGHVSQQGARGAERSEGCLCVPPPCLGGGLVTCHVSACIHGRGDGRTA